jgi:hypothetical protein
VQEVFHYVGERFFDNYPKWAVEVVDFEPLDEKGSHWRKSQAKES